MFTCPKKLHIKTSIALAIMLCTSGYAIAASPGAAVKEETKVQNVPKDPYAWLEDVEGKKALDWVRSENAVSTKTLEALPDFKPIKDRLRAILDSKERIPKVTKEG